jgi:hypothetical protein
MRADDACQLDFVQCFVEDTQFLACQRTGTSRLGCVGVNTALEFSQERCHINIGVCRLRHTYLMN